MSCVEKRHISHRMGSMLHHRFPNGFTDLFMDETDREVSTLTDRAFRSLCVGDDAVYNDEFLYGYSPFSCHKPLVGEPLKKTHHKESKKQGQNKNDKNYAQPWKQQQQKNISQMTSFLKALSATEESCEGMLIKNGEMTDSKGESWDKSALRSIQRELSEFSSDYHANLTDGHYKNHHRHHSSDNSSNKTGKDGVLPSGKSSKIKNGKSTVKVRKLNIKNFFLHSEFSPFQTWGDFNRFPFGQEDTVLPTDNVPKWYDLPFYRELTEAHRKESLHTEEVQACQKAAVEPPPTAPKPIPPPPPPKVLPKPSATPAEKRCSSEGGDGNAAPWRRNRSRAKSVIPVNQHGIPPQENISKTVDESLCLVKKDARSVEVKAIEEASSLASTPFSICQLMTPLIPSRQPTETSEILQGVLSPIALDLPLRPHSEAKLTPEPVKRDNYKSLASSILFNLKDNRKRVKSRYSPPKFKTFEVPEAKSPQSDDLKQPQAASEGNASGLSTPAIIKDGQTVCSPVLESNNSPNASLTKHETERPLSCDYLLSNLLQTKREAAGSSLGEENPISPFIHSKKNKSPLTKKQNYPSLKLYKKASPIDSDLKYLQVPLSTSAQSDIHQPAETSKLSPLMQNKELSPKALPTNTGLSSNTLNVNKDRSPIFSPHAIEKEELSSNIFIGQIPLNVPDKEKQPAKDIKEKILGAQPAISKEKDTSHQQISTMDVIRAAREAINAAKNKALSITQQDSINKAISDTEETGEKEMEKKNINSKEMFSSKRERSEPENNNISSQSTNEGITLGGKKGNVRKEPPPVPKRTFVKSDLPFPFDKQKTHNVDKLINGDSAEVKVAETPSENEPVQKQGKLKHIFSARQNNYIKCQRYSVTDDDQGEEYEESDLKVDRKHTDEEMMTNREMKDSDHIINDLHALKELERARLGDRVLDNAKKKYGIVNIDEETRVKSDLISRELRNIKKGMLSMRGNTMAKRELFANKDKEQTKQESFAKIDSNVIVNKALFNDNYDKAKMALEEIISERQKRKNTVTEQDANQMFDKNVSDESNVTRVQQRKKSMEDSMAEAKKKQNASTLTLKERDLKERLGDLRDHNYIRQILSQTEPGLGETYLSGGRMALPAMDKVGNELNTLLKIKAKHDNGNLTEEVKTQVNEIPAESGDLKSQNEGQKKHAPPVPPRSKKGGNRGDESVTMETGSLKDVEEEEIFNKDGKYDNCDVHLKEMRSTGSEKQEVDSGLPTKEAAPSQSKTRSDKERWDVVNNTKSKTISITTTAVNESISPLKYPRSENNLCLSPEFRGNETKTTLLQANISPSKEATFDNSSARKQDVLKIKQRAHLKPDQLNTSDDSVTNNLAVEEPDRIEKVSEEINMDAEALSETPRNILSPLLLVNGISINHSPPDQASLSSKSSYFSVESALHRNTEIESNVYHSLENLIGEADEVDEELRNLSQNTKQDSDRMDVEYYSLSDHESEPEAVKQPVTSPQREAEVSPKGSEEKENTNTDQSLTRDEDNQTPVSSSNTLSPTWGIPALFKVKDNTFTNKSKKPIQPWSPRGSLSGSERGEEELLQLKENQEPPPANEPATRGSTPIPDEILKPTEISLNSSPPKLLTATNLPKGENTKIPQVGGFLTVPEEEDRFSGVSPSSEGVDSFTGCTADTADELGMSAGVHVEREVSKVPSERSGSTCSGNDSQTGLPKPPAVLPKSEKAVLKAIKLANRRMKKEEAQKSSHKSSQSSSKHRTDKHKREKSEHKSNSSSRNSKGSEKECREKIEDGHCHSESHGKNNSDLNEQPLKERRSHKSENDHQDKAQVGHKTRRQSHDSVERNNQSNEALPSVTTERQGRSSNKHIRDKPEQRHYSSDRIISNVPVYKAHISDRPTSDKPFNRSHSIDRHLGEKVERRLSGDMSVTERQQDPRAQRIEKSIMDELQQRGRAKDKVSRDNPLRRSHSIDTYISEVTQPSTLSRQSSHTSHTSQLSRQSSIEHAIVTQSFPMTQRKLLQDPDSGHYFFVDMPVQVKTKTFFDPETGSYVQLPVQPPEGAVPQASPLEVLTSPMVVYHGFVPVPLSPLAQKATIQPPRMTPEEFEQRQLERSRQMHCKDRHPYLEPVYGQHEHMLGEFLGTEELDCPS